MNDLEIIEHWALREALVLWMGIAFVFAILALVSLIGALCFSTPWLFISAAAAVAAVSLCVWRMRRITHRLDELEQFIP
jgi:hypothetical protein